MYARLRRCWQILFNLVILFTSLTSSSTDEGTFWHLTDVHLDTYYDVKGDSSNYCHLPTVSSTTSKHNETSDLGPYGNHSCDSPNALMLSAFEAASTIERYPDFILWTGDNGPHLPDTAFSSAELLATLSNVTTELRRAFPSSPVLPVLGNHDVYPKDQLDPEPFEWCSQLSEIWRPLLSDFPGANITFSQGCFYRAEVQLSKSAIPMSVLVLNSLLWYTENEMVDELIHKDPAGQFAWLELQLKQILNRRKKALLVSHIPPGVSEVNPVQYKHLKPSFGMRLLNLMRKYSDALLAGFFAHEHSDTFRVLTSLDYGRPLLPLFLSPSVTPLHLRGLGSSLPSIRLYQYRRPNGTSHAQLMNYQQYAMDLDAANAAFPAPALPFWRLEYSANVTYGVTRLDDASAWLRVAEALRTDAELYAKYMQFHLAGGPHDYNWTEAVRQCYNFCTLTRLDAQPGGALDQCLVRECNVATSTVKSLDSHGAFEPSELPVSKDESVANREQDLSVVLTLVVILGFCATLIGISLTVNKAFCRRRRRTPLPTNMKPSYDYSRM